MAEQYRQNYEQRNSREYGAKTLQELGVAPSATLVGGLESTSVKVREHGAGALGKTVSKPSVDRATTSSMSRTYCSGIRRKSPSHFVTVVSTQPSCTDFEFHLFARSSIHTGYVQSGQNK